MTEETLTQDPAPAGFFVSAEQYEALCAQLEAMQAMVCALRPAPDEPPEEVDEMPEPRAKAERPWIVTEFHVPLGGGRDTTHHPDGTLKSPTERRTYIDPSIPEWVWVPMAEAWVNAWEEIDDHEQSEEPHLDELGYGGQGDAHETHGNPATRDYLTRQGLDTPELQAAYAAALKPFLDEARARAERGEARLPPDLDCRVYEKPEFAKLLEQPETITDQGGKRYVDPEHFQLLEDITVVLATADDGKTAAVIHPESGHVFTWAYDRDKARRAAEGRARHMGRRRVKQLLERQDATR